jgi:hypothetical protein
LLINAPVQKGIRTTSGDWFFVPLFQLASFSSIVELQRKIEGILHPLLDFKEKLKGFCIHCWTSKKN